MVHNERKNAYHQERAKTNTRRKTENKAAKKPSRSVLGVCGVSSVMPDVVTPAVKPLLKRK